MTRQLDFDRAFEAWLAEGPSQLSDSSIEDIVKHLHQTRQRRPGWPPRRQDMSRTLLALGGVAGAAVVVVIVGVLALGLNADRPGMGGQPSPPPTSGPTLQPTAEPTAQPSPTATPRPTRTPEADLPVGPFEVEDFGTVMTVTIPTSGWTFGDEWNGLVKGVERDNMPEAQIVFWTHPGVSEFDVYGDPCQWASTTPETVTTVHDFAAALAAQASRDASEPTDVTIGGVAGKSVVLHVPDDVEFSDCDQGRFASYGRAGANEPDRWHQGPGQIDQFWILDVDGTFVTIQAMWRPDTSAELVEEMRGIVESTTFEVP